MTGTIRCDICKKQQTGEYVTVNAGMVIGRLTVCKPCDDAHKAKAK